MHKLFSYDDNFPNQFYKGHAYSLRNRTTCIRYFVMVRMLHVQEQIRKLLFAYIKPLFS